MNGWPRVALAEVATRKGLIGGPFGSSLVGSDYEEHGIPVIRGTNLSQGRRVSGDFVFVSEEKFATDLSRNSAEPGDLVFTQRGTLGQVGIVPDGMYPKYVISQSQMRLRVDPRVASPVYVFYACSSDAFRGQVSDNAIATGVPHINLGILARLGVHLPPLAIQRGIAEVLGALDDKIAANTALAGTSDVLAALHVERLTQGADVRPLSQVADFVNGKAFTKGASGTGRVVIRIAELNSGLGGSTVFSDIEVADRYLARPGDILFAWSGSLTLSRWFRDEGIVNQHIFKVIPGPGYPTWLVHGLIARKLSDFKSIAADKATTMGHIQRHHLDLPVPVPSADLILANDALVSGLWDRALAAERESLQLAEVRDVLLPLLMSGKIRVKDAEEIVGDVV